MSILVNSGQVEFEIEIGDIRNDELSQFVSSVNIIENIFSPFIEANITIVDGASLKERMNLLGDERVIIKFKGINKKQTVYDLRVSRLESLIPTTTARGKAFTIKAVSPELIWDSMVSITKSYRKSSLGIIEDILKNETKSSKKIISEPTKDLEVIVVPYLSPFEAIDMIRKRTVSTKNASSIFTFFETHAGYTFKTIEQIIEDGVKYNVPTYTQKMELAHTFKGPASQVSDVDQGFTFYGYTVPRDFDLAEQLDKGALQTTLRQYDFVTKKLSTKKFQYDKKLFKNLNGTNAESQLSKQVIDKFYNTENKAFFIPFMSYRETANKKINFNYDVMLEKISFASIFTQYRTLISIPGNNELKAGDIIALDAPRYDENGGKNTVTSGNYLISTLNHNISIGLEPKYTCSLELLRGEKGKFKES